MTLNPMMPKMMMAAKIEVAQFVKATMHASLIMFPFNRDLQDTSVVIVSVGFLQNLAGLLQSPGDELSTSSGYELVRDKVGGTPDTALDTDLNLSTQVASVFVMGGYYPHSDLFSEFNFNCGRPFMGQVYRQLG